MIEWVATDAGVRAIGGGVEVTVETRDWRPDGTGHDLPRPVDARVAGSASALTVPAREALLIETRRNDSDRVSTPVRLPDGEYLLECDGAEELVSGRGPATNSGIETYVRFSGPARVRPDSDDGTLAVAFPEREPVTLAFRHDRETPPGAITAEPTPDGLAAVMPYLSVTHRTTGAARSHPALRGHPPLIELGDERSIPDRLSALSPDPDVELRVPGSFEDLLVSAPLAYYLGADVTIAEGGPPRVIAPSVGLDYAFTPMPDFQHEAANLLRRVFFLDCLVRDLGPADRPREESLLDRLDVPRPIAEAPIPERLDRYLRIPDERIHPALPDWHLSTYVAPEADHVRSLPFLLDNLSLIFLPEASTIDGKELVRRSLDDFYRARNAPVASVDVLEPELQAGRVHAWLADGTPVDAFKTTHSAYENRLAYRAEDRDRDLLRVAVVLNDREMDGEHSAVADVYRRRAAELPMEVTVHEYLRSDELRAVFAAPNDFVHYIGHCDVDGLRCPDGSFSASDLDECRTRTFFLNACGSYHEGLELVEKGSVAGAVTLTKVLDGHAAKVGTAFARLLVHGFGIERAMQLSRRRIMMGKDYAVVGDGTYSFTPCIDRHTAVAWLDRRGDTYHLTYEVVTARTNGGSYRPPFDDDRSHLYGTAVEYEFDREGLVEALDGAALPVIYDGEFYWSEALADRLRT